MKAKHYYLLLVVSSVIGCTRKEATAIRRPNIVLIMTDDQGYGDIMPFN